MKNQKRTVCQVEKPIKGVSFTKGQSGDCTINQTNKGRRGAMFRIKFCYWSNISEVLAIKIKETVIINIAGYVAPVVRAVKKLKRQKRKQNATANNFLTRCRNASILTRLAVRMLLGLVKLVMVFHR